MNTVSHQVTYVQPVKQLPLPTSDGGVSPAAHWQAIADNCRLYPSLWIPVEISGLTPTRLKSAVSEIRRGKLASFRTGAWEAARRGTKLYVRYLGEAHPLTFLRNRKAGR